MRVSLTLKLSLFFVALAGVIGNFASLSKITSQLKGGGPNRPGHLSGFQDSPIPKAKVVHEVKTSTPENSREVIAASIKTIRGLWANQVHWSFEDIEQLKLLEQSESGITSEELNWTSWLKKAEDQLGQNHSILKNSSFFRSLLRQFENPLSKPSVSSGRRHWLDTEWAMKHKGIVSLALNPVDRKYLNGCSQAMKMKYDCLHVPRGFNFTSSLATHNMLKVVTAALLESLRAPVVVIDRDVLSRMRLSLTSIFNTSSHTSLSSQLTALVSDAHLISVLLDWIEEQSIPFVVQIEESVDWIARSAGVVDVIVKEMNDVASKVVFFLLPRRQSIDIGASNPAHRAEALARERETSTAQSGSDDLGSSSSSSSSSPSMSQLPPEVQEMLKNMPPGFPFSPPAGLNFNVFPAALNPNTMPYQLHLQLQQLQQQQQHLKSHLDHLQLRHQELLSQRSKLELPGQQLSSMLPPTSTSASTSISTSGLRPGRTFKVTLRNGTVSVSPLGLHGVPSSLSSPISDLSRFIVGTEGVSQHQHHHHHQGTDTPGPLPLPYPSIPPFPLPFSLSHPQRRSMAGGILVPGPREITDNEWREQLSSPNPKPEVKMFMDNIIRMAIAQLPPGALEGTGPGGPSVVEVSVHLMPVPTPHTHTQAEAQTDTQTQTQTETETETETETSRSPATSIDSTESTESGIDVSSRLRSQETGRERKRGGGEEVVRGEKVFPKSFFRGFRSMISRLKNAVDTDDNRAEKSGDPHCDADQHDEEEKKEEEEEEEVEDKGVADGEEIVESSGPYNGSFHSSGGGGDSRGVEEVEADAEVEVEVEGESVETTVEERIEILSGLFRSVDVNSASDAAVRSEWIQMGDEEVAMVIRRENKEVLEGVLMLNGLTLQSSNPSGDDYQVWDDLSDILSKKMLSVSDAKAAVAEAVVVQRGVHCQSPSFSSPSPSPSASSSSTICDSSDMVLSSSNLSDNRLQLVESEHGLAQRDEKTETSQSISPPVSTSIPPSLSLQSHQLSVWAMDCGLSYVLKQPPPLLGGATPRSAVDLSTLSVDKYEKSLLACVVRPGDLSVTYNMIGGLSEVKEMLRQCITYPLKYPRLYQEGIAAESVKGVLLFGPPGTGKTMLAKAVATEGGATFLCLDAATMESKWLGESEKNARAVFSLARKLAPCVVYLDEVDSLLASREKGDDSSHGTLTSVKTTLMQEWDGLRTTKDRVVVIASTNRPFDLDEAVLRRLPRRILVDLPDQATRRDILQVTLARNRLAADVNLTQLAEKLDGYTGSDIKEVCREAVGRVAHLQAQAHEQGVTSWSGGKGGVFDLRPVEANDFNLAMLRLKASVNENGKELAKVVEWNEKYGEIKRKSSQRNNRRVHMSMYI